MFAYVKYLKDDVRTIVHTSKILNFAPTSTKDFSKHKVYMVFWSSNKEERIKKGVTGDTKENFYKSQILLMADTIEELQSVIDASRIPVAKLRNVDESSSNDSEDESLLKRRKVNRMVQAEKKVKAAEVNEERCKAILAKRKKDLQSSPLLSRKSKATDYSSDSNSDDDVVPKKLLLESETKYHRLKKTLSSFKKREAENMKSLEDFKLLQAKVEKLEEENKVLRKLNYGLQEEVIQRFKSDTAVVDSVNNEKKELPATAAEDDAFPADDGSVLLTKNVSIPKEKWDLIAQNSKDSIFIKDLAMAVWGSQHLKGRSLDGIPCNRLKSQGAVSKPPLTPEKLNAIKGKFEDFLREKGVEEEEIQARCKKIKSYISDKIMYLNRKERKGTGNN